jgi:hypothetical protein
LIAQLIERIGPVLDMPEVVGGLDATSFVLYNVARDLTAAPHALSWPAPPAAGTVTTDGAHVSGRVWIAMGTRRGVWHPSGHGAGRLPGETAPHS